MVRLAAKPRTRTREARGEPNDAIDGDTRLRPALLAASSPRAPAAAQADSAALVTVLGRDTLALERWVRTPERVTAEAVVRSPRTT